MRLKERIDRITAGIDVARLSREQVQTLDVSKLSREQWAALDITCLTVNQILEIGFDNLTEKQLDAIIKGECSWMSRGDAEWLHGLSDEELDAVAEGRYERCEPGFKPELSA